MSSDAARARLRVLGMQSGTSADAIDIAVVDFHRDDVDEQMMHGRIVTTAEIPWDPELRAQILDALTGSHPAGHWCVLDARAGDAFGEAARGVIEALDDGVPVDLVASHGQTLHHAVSDSGEVLGTWQIGAPSRIAARTDTPVLADLRSADVALGGQGAPLVPLLDELVLGDVPTVALNIGGIANISIIGGPEAIGGDTGPGCALLDAAVVAATGGLQTADVDGRLARAGRVHEDLLSALLEDPFYTLPFPRSTGREHFSPRYVDEVARRALGPGGVAEVPTSDLVATLTELTARTIAQGIDRALDSASASLRPRRVVAAGGGMRNPALRDRLTALLAARDMRLVAPEAVGLPSDAKEAVLFALIGCLSAWGLPSTLARPDGTAITGASRPAVLGSLTPPDATVSGRSRTSRRQRPTRLTLSAPGCSAESNERTLR